MFLILCRASAGKPVGERAVLGLTFCVRQSDIAPSFHGSPAVSSRVVARRNSREPFLLVRVRPPRGHARPLLSVLRGGVPFPWDNNKRRKKNSLR
jgi:hypothetical protein